MVRIQQLNKQFMVTLPIDVVKQVKLEKGEEVTIVPDQYDKDIIIKRRR